MKKMIMNFLRDEEGVTAIEYALIAGLVAVVAIAGWTTLGTNVNDQAGKIATKVGTVTPSQQIKIYSWG